MGKQQILLIFGIFLLFAASVHAAADCSAKAYRNSCASCTFDANGKMDQSCYGGYKASGIACSSAAYPIASGKYAAGQCAQIDACASQLSTCTSQMGSGNDKADCQEGSMVVCFAAADQCMQTAAVACGEIENQTCTGAPAALILPVLLAGFVAYAKKK